MNAVLADKPSAAIEAAPKGADTTLLCRNATQFATEAAELAEVLVIDSADMYQIAAEELQTLTTRRKRIEEWRLSITRPMDEAKNRVMAMFRTPIESIEKSERKIKSAMLDFKRAEDARLAAERAEAERKAREEREAAERLAREAEERAEAAREQVAAAIEQGDTEQVAQALEAEQEAVDQMRAAETTAALAEMAPSAMARQTGARASGVATRQTWKAEVVDFKALVIAAGKLAETGNEALLAYLMPDMTALNGTARSTKGKTTLPGVRVYAESGIAVRGSGR